MLSAERIVRNYQEDCARHSIVLEDLRRRNGELFDCLQSCSSRMLEAGLDPGKLVEAALNPPTDYPSRRDQVEKFFVAAHDYVRVLLLGEDPDSEWLVHCFSEVEDYLPLWWEELERRRVAARKAAAKRRSANTRGKERASV